MITRLFTYRHHNGLRAAVVALSCESEAAANTDLFRATGEGLALSVAAMELDDAPDYPLWGDAPWYGSESDLYDAAQPTIDEHMKWLGVQLRERVPWSAVVVRADAGGGQSMWSRGML